MVLPVVHGVEPAGPPSTVPRRTPRLRRLVTALAGPLGALALLAATSVAVPGTDELLDDRAGNAAILAAVGDDRNRTAAAGLLVVLGLLALVPFVWSMGSLSARRGAALATWGSGLAALGLAGAAVANTFWFTNVRMTDPALSGSRDSMVQLMGTGTWPLAVLGVMEIVCLPLGWILLGVGLRRSRAVGWLLPILWVLGLALFLVLPDHLAAVGAAVLVVTGLWLVPPIAQTDRTNAQADRTNAQEDLSQSVSRNAAAEADRSS